MEPLIGFAGGAVLLLAAVATVLGWLGFAPNGPHIVARIKARLVARRLREERLQKQVEELQGQVAGLIEGRASRTGQVTYPISVNPNTPEQRLNDFERLLEQWRDDRTRQSNETSIRFEALEKARDALQAEDKHLTDWITSFHVMRDPDTGEEVWLDIPEVAARVGKLAADFQVLQTMQYALLSRVLSPEETGLLHSALALAERIRADVKLHPDLKNIFTGIQVVDNPVSSEHPRGWGVQVLDALTDNLPVYMVTWEDWESVKAIGFVEAEGSAL